MQMDDLPMPEAWPQTLSRRQSSGMRSAQDWCWSAVCVSVAGALLGEVMMMLGALLGLDSASQLDWLSCIAQLIRSTRAIESERGFNPNQFRA